jgi:leader peptidase (prepilin peptidase) / N-methyltransferase
VTTAQLLQANPSLLIAIVVVLGLLVGSFLNVVIHRLPIMMERDWRRQCEELDAIQADVSARSAEPSIEPMRREETTELAVQYSQAVTGSVTEVHSAFSAEPAAEPAFNLLTPRSRCPNCRAQIHAWQNIPIVSYLLLRGRCASCHAHISVRYPLVELLSGALSALAAWRFGLSWELGAALLFTWSLIALSGIDIDRQLLPDSITLPLLWLGLLLSLAHDPQSGFSMPVDPRSSIIGAAAGYLSLWSVFHLFCLLTGKEGMGYGDFKLFAAFGAWFGWELLLLIILLAAATGAIVGIVLVVLKRQGKELPIPFGPYLAGAGWIALIWGPQIVERYLHLSGLH